MGANLGGHRRVVASYDTGSYKFFKQVPLVKTERTAVDTLTRGLVKNGTWDKYVAIYPMVGGTSGSHKWNLKDPRDSDDAYRLTFTGSWTHNDIGAKGDGSTAWAQSWFTDSDVPEFTSSSSCSIGIGFYSNDEGTSGTYRCEWGTDTPGALLDVLMQLDDGGGQWRQFYGPNGRITATPGYKKMVVYNAESGSGVDEYNDGVALPGTSGITYNPTGTYYVLCSMGQASPTVRSTGITSGSRNYDSDARCALAYISNGLVDADIAPDYDVFEEYQTILRRSNVPPIDYIESWNGVSDSVQSVSASGLSPNENDYLIAVGNANDQNIFDTPSGWTSLGSSAASGQGWSVFGKISDGTETSLTLDLQGATNDDLLILSIYNFRTKKSETTIAVESTTTYGAIGPNSDSQINAISSSEAMSLGIALIGKQYNSEDNFTAAPDPYIQEETFFDTGSNGGRTYLYSSYMLESQTIPSSSITFSNSNGVVTTAMVLKEVSV